MANECIIKAFDWVYIGEKGYLFTKVPEVIISLVLWWEIRFFFSFAIFLLTSGQEYFISKHLKNTSWKTDLRYV